MTEILGYGEDAFTFWMLKKHLSEVLGKLGDHSKPSDCLIFFRPRLGYGEFDAILASSENIYLIESKCDQFGTDKKGKIKIVEKQQLRHKIFSWYYTNWDVKQHPDWEKLRDNLQSDFTREFPTKKIAPPKSLTTRNLKFVLGRLQEHSKKKLINVLLFFYDKNNSNEIKEIIPNIKDIHFEIINIDYNQYKNDFEDTFVTLD